MKTLKVSIKRIWVEMIIALVVILSVVQVSSSGFTPFGENLACNMPTTTCTHSVGEPCCCADKAK